MVIPKSLFEVFSPQMSTGIIQNPDLLAVEIKICKWYFGVLIKQNFVEDLRER